MYEIVRFFIDGTQRVIKKGLTLEEAQEHCSDPETSSATCESSYRKRYTKKHGGWFDGFRKM